MTTKAITGEDLLRAKPAPGKPSAGEVFDVIYMDETALKRAEVEALLHPEAVPEWKRRLLAFRRTQPKRRKPSGPPPDIAFARRFFELRDSGLSHDDAVAQLSPHDDPDDRAVEKKVARAKRRAIRLFRENAELLEAASRAIKGE